MREISYAQQTLNSSNPITRFAHRSRYALSLELADALLPVGGTLLDFGAGEGAFLAKISALRSDVQLIALEPHMSISMLHVRQISQLGELGAKSVDLIGAFEVLEHVTDEELAEFLADCRRVLKLGGRLLISVPIMYGAMLPVKELCRFFLHRRWSDIEMGDLFRATLGIPIERPTDRRRTHRGFDFRDLSRRLEALFDVEKRLFSPFATLPWAVNSQAFFVARVKT